MTPRPTTITARKKGVYWANSRSIPDPILVFLGRLSGPLFSGFLVQNGLRSRQPTALSHEVRKHLLRGAFI